MEINNSKINIDEIIDIDNTCLKDIGNGIYISNEEANVLDRYDINYKNCNSLNELIFQIEDYLNDSYEELDDLETLSSRLSEFNYYNNTKK